MYSTFEYHSADGTKLEGWMNNGDGPVVVVCNGPGVPRKRGPACLSPIAGIGCSDTTIAAPWDRSVRKDLDRIRIDDHVADAFTVGRADRPGQSSSLGHTASTSASEITLKRYPERVAYLVMCAGVPWNKLDAAFAFPRSQSRCASH